MSKADLDAPVGRFSDGIVIVSHDATRTGAPLIALNIARGLVEEHRVPIVTVLLSPGELEPDFARIGPVFVRRLNTTPPYQLEPRRWARSVKRIISIIESKWHGGDDRFWRRISKYLAERQIRYAVCNTVFSGDAARRLNQVGVTSIGLIHELPHSIRSYGWSDQVAALIQGASALIFPCPEVRNAFSGAFPIANKASFTFPQGININPDNVTGERRTAIRSAFRTRIGLTRNDVLVLGCGNGDFRKGIDLFVHAAREIASSAKLTASGKIVFAWAGPADSGFRTWVDKDIVELNLSDRLIFLGPQQEMASCFTAADIFFLSSREDPFPSVVLEAMASGLPVIGFAGSGGIEEQIRGGGGVAVPYCDVAAAVKAIHQLAERADERTRMGAVGRQAVTTSGGYREYSARLLDVLAAVSTATLH